jgi:DNA-binding Lrp family transcriptional regulator
MSPEFKQAAAVFEALADRLGVSRDGAIRRIREAKRLGPR